MNAKYPQSRVRVTNRKITKARLEGFMMGVWTAAYIFRDKYMVSDEDVKAFIDESAGLMADFGTGRYDYEAMFHELEEMTGIRYRGFYEV